MDNKLKELVEDLDKVMSLIKKIGEATPEDVDSLKEDIIFTRDKIKSKYGKQDPPETDPQKT